VTAGSWIRFLPGGRLSTKSWLKQLIQIAYGVEDYRVVGGPSWLTSDWYDIEAKAASASADRGEMTLMLKSLLSDRFNLRVREELRDFAAYNLVVDKNGPRLRPLKDGEASRCTRDNSALCGVKTVGTLAKVLQYSVGRPIFDKTGIDGRFDILLDYDSFSIRGQTPPSGYEKPSLFTALQEQLGLKLESTKAPVDVLVIDHVERPTPD
jgi:uncharacterized protein (TIGR03435 family)